MASPAARHCGPQALGDLRGDLSDDGKKETVNINATCVKFLNV